MMAKKTRTVSVPENQLLLYLNGHDLSRTRTYKSELLLKPRILLFELGHGCGFCPVSCSHSLCGDKYQWQSLDKSSDGESIHIFTV